MITESEFLKRLTVKGNPRWTKEGWEKPGWREGESRWNLQEAKEVLDAVFDTLTECLAEGEGVMINGFGKFEIRQTKARMSVDLANKEIYIPAHKRVHFTQSRPLRALVDNCDSGGDK